MSKTNLPAVRKPTPLAPPRELEDWEKQLQNKARDERSSAVQGAPRVTHESGILEIDGNEVKEKRLAVTLLGFCHAKVYYDKPYVKGVSATPVCYAFSRDGRGMVPHPNAPVKQNTDCTTCQHNVFGTATLGKGKRCGDKIRVMMLLTEDLAKQGEEEAAKAIQKAVAYQMDVPATSIKGFGQFVQSLAGVTTYGSISEAIAEISTEPRKGGAYFVNFKFLGEVPREAKKYLMKRTEGIYEQLSQPFPVLSDDEEKPKQSAKPVKGQGQKGK